MAKIYIVIHSIWHHIAKLAEAVKKGVEKVPGVEVTIFQVRETLSPEVLKKMWAPEPPPYPVIEPQQLTEADGFLFGVPTRYGIMSAQLKTFWDATGGLWMSRALVGKAAGIFHSTSSQHGGQETTSLTFVTHLAHHGIIYVPLGYTHPALTDNTEVIGGSAYGAGTITNPDGSRQPTEKELAIAEFQGEEFAKNLLALVKGREVLAKV